MAAAGAITPLNVQVRITTTGVSKAASSMKAVTSASTSMGRGLGSGVIGARTLGDAMRMTASLIKYTVVGVFMNAGKQAIQMSRQFELAFARIKGLVVITGDSLDKMKSKVLALAGETTRAPLELADALYFITSAGIKESVIALEVLENAAKAAAAGLGTTNTVADAITSTMNAYGEENMSAARAADILVATVREGKAEADTFAPALGKILPIAAAYGASFEDISAAIAALSRGGLSAGTAAIYVRQTLSQLLKPSKQAIDVLKGVGLSAESIRDKVQNEGLFPALMMLRDRLGGIENAGSFTKVFGNVRALTAVLSLVGPAADENAEIFERLNNATGDLDYAFKQYSETLDSKFNKKTAESQAALIALGDSLKPLVEMFLGFGTQIAKLFSKFAGNSFGKAILKIASVLVILVAVFAMFLKTQSAFVRIGSNANIILAGQNLLYNTQTGAIQVLTASTTASTTATTASTVATTGLGVANTFAAKTALYAARAMRYMTMAMMPLLALTAAIMAFQMFQNFGKGDGEKNIKGLAGKVSQLNELLDEAAKYAKTGLIFEINLDMKQKKKEMMFQVLAKELEDAAPGFTEGVIQVATDQGDEAALAYVNAVVQTKFGGNSDALKSGILEFFLDTLTLDPSVLKATTARTGNAVADAATEAALIAARQANGAGFKFSAIEISSDKTDIAEALIEQIGEGGGNYVNRAAKAFGLNFSEGITETAELTPLLLSLEHLSSGLTTVEDKAKLTTDVLGSALQGLTGEFDLLGDREGNLAKMFSMKDNEAGLKKIVKSTFDTKTPTQTVAVFQQIQTALLNVGKGADKSGEAFEIFIGILNDHKAKAKEVETGFKTLDQSMSAIEDRFRNGLSPAVQDIADEFKAANAAIDQFKRGQEALMGLTRTGIEAQIAYRDSLRSFAEDASEAGGNLFGTSKGADKAKEGLLSAMDGVLEVANNFAGSGQTEQAAAAFGQGITQIMAAGMQAGLDQEDIQKFFDMNNFNKSMLATFAGAGDDLHPETSKIGEQLTAGLAAGIDKGKPFVDAAIGNLSAGVIADLKKALLISSPSKKIADEIGKPSAQGFAMGFQKEMAGNSGKSIGKSLQVAVEKAYKGGGRKGANTFFEKFLEKKGKVEDPAGDFVKESIGRMKDIVGALGDYIKSQLDFRKAKADLAKLINMQRGLDDRKKKAARDTQFAGTRFGGNGGAEVTGYEQSRIDVLQMDFEKASRSYAMGRTTYADLIDSEIALFEARAAASEVSDELLNSQNAFVDATVNLENEQLDLASSTVGVLSAFQNQQEAAANLYKFHLELGKVYTDLAKATGIANGELKVGTKDLFNLGTEAGKLGGFVSTVGSFTSTLGGQVITTKAAFDKDFFGDAGVFSNIVKASGNVNTLTKDIGADFTNLSRGLLDPESEMYKNLASLGPSIFKAIQTSAQNSLDQSPLNLDIRVNATINGSGKGFKLTADLPDLGTNKDLTGNSSNAFYSAGKGGTSISRTPGYQSIATTKKVLPISSEVRKAVGGPVVGMKPYLVGEKGPEMFVPKVSGTIVTSSALSRYTRVKEKSMDSAASTGSNINVTVNNPVPEAAQDSITRRMKVLANSGMFG